MARRIDITQPLSEEDVAYLDARGRDDLLERNRQLVGEQPDRPQPEGQHPAEPTTAGTADRQTAPDGANPSPLNLGNQQAATPKYETWSKTRLKEEIEGRNNGRESDEQLSTKGTVKELAERLREDDGLTEPTSDQERDRNSTDYINWTDEELLTEIAERNENRDEGEQISTEDREQAIRDLRADDEKHGRVGSRP